MSSSARIDELRKKFDENPRRFFAPLANEYRKVGDFEQAVFICQEYLPQQPGHMSGHIVYGQTLFDMGRDEEARGVFETALTLDPENLIALKHLGDIARQAGDLEGARSWYHRVLDADPRNDEIMQVLESLGGAGAGVGPVAMSESAGTDQSSPPSFSEAASPEFEPEATHHQSDSASELGFEVSEQREPDEELVLEQSVDADLPDLPDLPVAEPEIVAASSVADEATETETHELLDLDDFSLGAAEVSTENVPQAEPVGSAESIEIDEFVAEPAAESASMHDDESAEPEVELATDIILGLPDDTPQAATEQVSGFEAEQPPVASENLTRAIDQLDGLETFSIDAPPPPLPDAALDASVTVEEPATPDAFATETMADLYVQQGHLESALDIYDQLLERSPDDTELRRRAGEVERQFLGDNPSEATEDDVIAIVSSEMVDAATAGVTADPTVAGPTIRDFFRELLQGRTVQDEASETPAASLESTSESPSIESEGSIDILFSEAPTAEDDHSAAVSLAQAFGNEEQNDESAALNGTPAHPAMDELSLDHVFRSATPAKGSGTAGAFSLDQFFAGEMASAEMPGDASEGAQRSSDDIAQFNAWLNGLKKT